MTQEKRMKVLVFLGSVRESVPPRPARLGTRVALACEAYLSNAGIGAEIVDPLDLERRKIFKPQFAYAKGKAPEDLERLGKRIRDADAYVMVSPEYNHSMSPALADMLNHFGSSSFSFKPSAIVTYSAGQWGGARAAVNMRTYLSELGCLPVSAMIHVPKAQDVFDENGHYAPDVDAQRWDGYIGRTIDQLIWWAEAANRLRQEIAGTPSFDKDPSQRNAP